MPIVPALGGTPVSLVASADGALTDPLTGATLATSAGTTRTAARRTTTPTAITPAAASPASSSSTTSVAVATATAPSAPAARAPAAPVTTGAISQGLVNSNTPLTPAGRYAGTAKPVNYTRFASQFSIGLRDLNHLLKLANPAKYGKVFATDVFGKQYEISGTRSLNSFGNNLSNAGIDGKYGTADDIKATDSKYKKNSQGLGAEYWANAEIPFARLTKPEWGNVNGAEDIGRPAAMPTALTSTSTRN